VPSPAERLQYYCTVHYTVVYCIDTCVFIVCASRTRTKRMRETAYWHEFGLVMTKDNIPRLDEILRQIPEDVIVRKRKAMGRCATGSSGRARTTTPSQNPPKR